MSKVTIKIFGQQATIEGYRSASENKRIQEFLNIRMDPDGPSPSDPFPEYHAALDAIKEDDQAEIIEVIDDREMELNLVY